MTLNGSADNNEAYLGQLLDQAYIQTNNFQDTIKNDNYYTTITGTSAQQHRSSYTPGGKIRIFDTRLNTLIGMEGVKVRARRWFTAYRKTTDFNGNYRMNHDFKRPANYSLKFKTDNFSVREHLFGLTSWINGPKLKGDWSYDILDGEDRFIGTIFRGAFRYHYKDIAGLTRPFTSKKQRLTYIGKDYLSENAAGINLAPLKVIKISKSDRGTRDYNSDEVFSATCHETAHTTHTMVCIDGVIQYALLSDEIRESWAVGVEWQLAKLEYQITRGLARYGEWDYHASNLLYPNDRGYQYWNMSLKRDYTTLFINLVDNFNEFNQPFPEYAVLGSVNDQVSGYTMANLEKKVMKYTGSFSRLKIELKKNKPAGVSDAQIYLLLNYY